MKSDEPLVSIITPVYNTEEFVAECIESVLGQTYSNFEYIVLDNCSSDASTSIAESYASADPRMRLVKSTEFLPQLANYNRALRLMSPKSRYCKVVQADDWLLPDCVEKMVNVAEQNPSVGVVSGYTLLDYGDRSGVYLTGLPFRSAAFDGRAICREFLLQGLHVFGSPTMTMFRAEIVRAKPEFYGDSVIADTIVYLEALQEWDLGFVHDIVTYTRRYNESYMSLLRHYHYMDLTKLLSLRLFGPVFLTDDEYRRRGSQVEARYRLAIGESALKRRPKEFWDFQRRALREIGINLGWGFRTGALLTALVDIALNPKSSLSRLAQYRRSALPVDPGKVKDYLRP